MKFPPPEDVDHTCVNEQLPRLLDSKDYHKPMQSIFQSVQTEKSDKKRRQAKMMDVAAMAEKRVSEAQTAFRRFRVDTVSPAKDVAHTTLLGTKDEQLLVHKVIGHMCERYNCIQEVSLMWFFFSYQNI